MFSVKETFLYSDKNGREENQDHALSIISDTAPADDSRMLIFCVMDGVSGNNGGEAVRCAAPVLRACLSDLAAAAHELTYNSEEESEDQIHGMLCDAILEADLHLHPIGCTTISIAVVFSNHVYAANVGDSPIFLIDLPAKPGEPTIKELFQCHNKAGGLIWDDHLLTQEQLKQHAYDSCRLLRCAGSFSGLTKDDIHIATANLRSNSMLLLGSDGALSVLCKKVLLELAAQTADSCPDGMLKPFGAALYDKILEQHATDNFTLAGAILQRI